MAILSHQLPCVQYAMECGIWSNLCGAELDRPQLDLACFLHKRVPKRAQNLDTEVSSMRQRCAWRAERGGKLGQGWRERTVANLEVVWPLAASRWLWCGSTSRACNVGEEATGDGGDGGGLCTGSSGVRGLIITKGVGLAEAHLEWWGGLGAGLRVSGSLKHKRGVLAREEGGLGEARGNYRITFHYTN